MQEAVSIGEINKMDGVETLMKITLIIIINNVSYCFVVMKKLQTLNILHNNNFKYHVLLFYLEKVLSVFNITNVIGRI